MESCSTKSLKLSQTANYGLSLCYDFILLHSTRFSRIWDFIKVACRSRSSVVAITRRHHPTCWLKMTKSFLLLLVFGCLCSPVVQGQWSFLRRSRQVVVNDNGTIEEPEEQSEVCYGPELGCFTTQEPFDNVIVLPDSPEAIDTKFILYTRDNQEVPQVINYEDRKSLIEGSQFRSARPNKFIVHGFVSGCNKHWVQQMKTFLLAVCDCNVICVDWRKGAARHDYFQAASNVQLVGKQISVLINDLRESFGRELKFHLIGFSLGAHVAGAAGREAKDVDRISGLDPAGPLFESYNPTVRLDKTDAKFVDVIHSSGDTLMDGGVGTMIPMGHVDFYPNGGRSQTGCSERFILNMVRDLFRRRPNQLNSTADPYGGSLCNHKRVYKLYTQSILPGYKFPAYKCDIYGKFLSGHPDCSANSTRTMGYYADDGSAESQEQQELANSSSTESPNRYYLLTNGFLPFSANHLLVQVKFPTNVSSTIMGKLEVMTQYAGVQSELLPMLRSYEDEVQADQTFSRVLPIPQTNSTVESSGPHTITFRYLPYRGWFARGSPSVVLGEVTSNFLESKQSWKSCDSALRLFAGQFVTLKLDTESCYQRI